MSKVSSADQIEQTIIREAQADAKGIVDGAEVAFGPIGQTIFAVIIAFFLIFSKIVKQSEKRIIESVIKQQEFIDEKLYADNLINAFLVSVFIFNKMLS